MLLCSLLQTITSQFIPQEEKFLPTLPNIFFLVSHKIYISSKKTNNALKFAEVYTKYICATKRV